MRHFPHSASLALAPRPHGRASSLTRILSLAALGAGLTGCGGGDDDDGPVSFVLAAATHSSAASSPILGDRDLLAYFADEATTGPGGTDLNGNTFRIDSVPIVSKQ